MKVLLRSLLASSLALSLSLTTPSAFAQEQADQADVQTYRMFAHFINVARPDQAQPFGEKLLAMDNAQMLAAIEGDRLHKFEELAKWGISDELKPTWQAIADKRQVALTERSRDAAQIRADIQALGGTREGEYLAIQRLKVTGQFAAPYYLEVLQDQAQRRLHPRVVNAMIEVGAELSYPLSVALPSVDPTTAEYIAGIVGEIGHPEALPYLKVVTEGDAGSSVKAACQAAFNKITETSGVDSSGTAAQLFVRLGEAKYAKGTTNSELLGMDLPNETGILWIYNNDTALFPIAVAQRVYADSLAMQNAKAALELDAEYFEAVTLHIASNLRRENRLDGEQDPGYSLPNPATFYLLVAGAPQQKAVLERSLADADPALALDAIEAMSASVGNSVLLGSDETKAPVLDALFFADRRVRFTAAATLASAAPKAEFPGFDAVVPVLGQAVRQTDELNAVVVAPAGKDAANAMLAMMENVDFKAVGDTNLAEASGMAVAAMPGVDLLVYTGDLAGYEAFYAAAKANGALSVVPILALVDSNVASAIKLTTPGVVTASPILEGEDELDRLETLAKKAIDAFGGDPMDEDEAETYATLATVLLAEIAANPSIYNAGDVEPILIEALDDDRNDVATGAGQVLELLDSVTAQKGLAKVGLDRVGTVQVDLLNSLAESAKDFGNRLDRADIDKLIELVNTSSGETALAAAGALGALTERPTSDTTGFILGE